MCQDHPPKEYYINLGFSEKMAEQIVEGFKVDDYPTREEWIKGVK